MCADGRILAAQAALHAALKAHGLALSDVADHFSALGLDARSIEEKATLVTQVTACLSSAADGCLHLLSIAIRALTALARRPMQTLEEVRNDAGWHVSSNSDLRVLYRHKKGTRTSENAHTMLHILLRMQGRHWVLRRLIWLQARPCTASSWMRR